MRRLVVTAAAVLMTASALVAQQRPASPPGTAATQVGPKYSKWVEVRYGRPILRGRSDIFGSGADYGRKVLAGAPIWRAGANVATTLHTEVPLVIGGKTVPAGEHTLFIDTKSDKEWTLVVSSWKALQNPKEKDPTALWGGYGYTPDKDIVRAAMKVDTSPSTVDQLTWSFVNVTEQGGTLQIAWAKTVASVPFTVGS
jgi:hypothetical protein